VVVNDIGVAIDGSGHDDGPAQQVVSQIEAAGGVALANTTDIAEFDGAGALIDSAIDKFGQLDIVVNVAGILRDRMIFNMSPEEWDAVIRVHLRGTFNMTRHASSYWRGLKDENASHRLINFASDSGIYGQPGQPNYAAAKMGIIGLTLSCANALKKYGVTSNAVAPVANTRMVGTVQNKSERSESREERAPEDVAELVAVLAAPDSGWCNGRVIGVSGNSVHLYSNPVVVSRLVAESRWDAADLGPAMKTQFGSVAQGSEGRYDYLNAPKPS